METTIILGLYRVCIGIMESRMETTIILGLYRVCIGIMESRMETTIIWGGCTVATLNPKPCPWLHCCAMRVSKP